MTALNSPSEPGRDGFWATPIALPPDLRLTRQETVVVPRRGRGGESALDLVRLDTPSSAVTLLVEFRASLLPRDIPVLKQRLLAILEQLRLRRIAAGQDAPPTIPALATDAASRAALDACVREGVALLDRRGTAVVHGPAIFIHVEGKAAVVRRSRVRLFHGKASRIVRWLLARPGEPFKLQQAAAGAETSYAFAHGVVTRLERDGFLERPSPRAPFRFRDPAGLLRTWIESGERTAIRVEPYFAPNTRPETLAKASAACRAAGVRCRFTLASGLRPEEVFVSGLPHGAYVSGDPVSLVNALGLRNVTPHNFLVLTPEVAAEAPEGGLSCGSRTLPHGEAVGVPQLTVDFAGLGGRGREQANRLLEIYAGSLPITVDR